VRLTLYTRISSKGLERLEYLPESVGNESSAQTLESAGNKDCLQIRKTGAKLVNILHSRGVIHIGFDRKRKMKKKMEEAVKGWQKTVLENIDRYLQLHHLKYHNKHQTTTTASSSGSSG
jgi:hypothetical protein